MRYASIRSTDISDGEGVGISLFVQGCHFHCKNCFNQSTWDFNGGEEFTIDIKEEMFRLLDKPYIMRISILGGEPLSPPNRQEVCDLCEEIKQKFPDKIIWLYTGYTFKEIQEFQSNIFDFIDVLVDGRYEDEKRNLRLRFRGSTNQNIWRKNEMGWYISQMDIKGDYNVQN